MTAELNMSHGVVTRSAEAMRTSGSIEKLSSVAPLVPVARSSGRRAVSHGVEPLVLRYAVAPFSPVRCNFLHQRITRPIQIIDSRRETALRGVIEEIVGG
jgi:hypothetical protein